MSNDRLAPPLSRDYDAVSDERRGSWVGEFDPARRTSFANAFLEMPPEREAKFRNSFGAMHYVPLDEEADLMGTPPISPVATRHSKNSSYFESPIRSRIGTDEQSLSRTVGRTEDEQESLFSTLFNKAFETVTRSGEALDMHGKGDTDLSNSRRAAKGKGRAIDFGDGGRVPQWQFDPDSGPTSLHGGSTKVESPNGLSTATSRDKGESYMSPLEETLVTTLEAAEKKVTQVWAWLTDDTPVGPDYGN